MPVATRRSDGCYSVSGVVSLMCYSEREECYSASSESFRLPAVALRVGGVNQ